LVVPRQRFHLVVERFRVGRAHQLAQVAAEVVGGKLQPQRGELGHDAREMGVIG